MKQYGYRYQNVNKKGSGRSTAYKIIVYTALFAAVVLFLYKAWDGGYFGENSIKVNDVLKAEDESNSRPPAVTVNLDGLKYIIDAAEDSTESTATDDEGQTLGIGKNSKFEILFDDPPDNFNITIYKDNTVVLSGMDYTISSDDLSGDGEYKCICEAVWDTGKYKGMAYYNFKLLAEFPYELSISSSETNPGELLVICADNLNPGQSLEIETDLDFKPNAFQYGNKRIIMLPVSYNNVTDKVYQVKVNIDGEVNSFAIKLNDKAFTTQNLTIDKNIAAETRNDKSAKEMEDKIYPLKSISDGQPYWSGKFILPVENGRLEETDFGKRRFVNNSPTSYRHNGLDIGQDKGAPVMASNSGRVLFAGSLIETGNTVIIEHGFGLKTWYYHMNELLVKSGDFVTQGDIIGKVGSTGFSTSPHLHFSASVNNVFINPVTLINDGVPLIRHE
jgi:murein DD-endopeptidase MepM/ murein hydrolase activator NlpD